MSGNWTADFSVQTDGQPAFDITDITRIDTNEMDDDATRPPAIWSACYGEYRRGSYANRQQRLGCQPQHRDGHTAQQRWQCPQDDQTGQIPTGVAADAAGKVWATNLGSDNTVRIDPKCEHKMVWGRSI